MVQKPRDVRAKRRRANRRLKRWWHHKLLSYAAGAAAGFMCSMLLQRSFSEQVLPRSEVPCDCSDEEQ